MVSSLNEYVCEDCGCLLIHGNPLTLESMRDVHKQLCVIKRQKAIAAESAKPVIPTKPSSVTAKATASASSLPPPTPSLSSTSPSPASPPPTPLAPSALEGGGTRGGGNTTISLTGSGTNYSKVDGPIDANFKSSRQQAGT
ncbi:MAG: hypothetical protein M3250_04130, partial [Thermoproteota archaeon]|nr:hypothetical protein [Thermoproteota archaeon]